MKVSAYECSSGQHNKKKNHTPKSAAVPQSTKMVAMADVKERESAPLPSKLCPNQKASKIFPKSSGQPQVNHKENMKALIQKQTPGVKYLRELREDYIAIFDTFITKHRFKYVLRMQPNVAWWQEGRKRALVVKCQLDEAKTEKLLDILASTTDPILIDEVCFHLDFLPLTYIVREHVRNQLMNATKFIIRGNHVSISSMYQVKRERNGGQKIQPNQASTPEYSISSGLDVATASAPVIQPKPIRSKSSML
ncbi:hypothetical protein BIW11_06440 [Tropilaelaps mercedesae]|nr:hypothetical protein BIW11_06440 [Tropilaelaps mercedesae]